MQASYAFENSAAIAAADWCCTLPIQLTKLSKTVQLHRRGRGVGDVEGCRAGAAESGEEGSAAEGFSEVSG